MGKSVTGQLCSGEDAGDDHLTVPRCLSSCLKTDTVRGQESATPGKHQDPGSGRDPLPLATSTLLPNMSSDTDKPPPTGGAKDIHRSCCASNTTIFIFVLLYVYSSTF